MRRSKEDTLYLIINILLGLIFMFGGVFVVMMLDRGLTFEGVISLIRSLI